MQAICSHCQFLTQSFTDKSVNDDLSSALSRMMDCTVSADIKL